MSTKLPYVVGMLLLVAIATPAFAAPEKDKGALMEEQFGRVIEKFEGIIERHTVEEEHHMGIVEAVEPIPTLDLVVHSDPKIGYNLELRTTNYKFTPENASTPHIDGEGHAHLYIDGEKITRIYGSWFYLNALPAGEHTIRVELSANNHSTYAHNGVKIDDTEVILVE